MINSKSIYKAKYPICQKFDRKTHANLNKKIIEDYIPVFTKIKKFKNYIKRGIKSIICHFRQFPSSNLP